MAAEPTVSVVVMRRQTCLPGPGPNGIAAAALVTSHYHGGPVPYTVTVWYAPWGIIVVLRPPWYWRLIPRWWRRCAQLADKVETAVEDRLPYRRPKLTVHVL